MITRWDAAAAAILQTFGGGRIKITPGLARLRTVRGYLPKVTR